MSEDRSNFQKDLDSILRQRTQNNDCLALETSAYLMPVEWQIHGGLEDLTEEHIFAYTHKIIFEWKRFEGDFKSFKNKSSCGMCGSIFFSERYEKVLTDHKEKHPDLYKMNGGRCRIKRRSSSKRDKNVTSVKNRRGGRNRSYKKRRITKK